MNSKIFLTIFFCLAAFSGHSLASECYVGTSGFGVKTTCSPFQGCMTVDTSGILTKSCLVSNSTCGTTVGSAKTTCCYTSLCNSGYSVNMSPFHLFLVIASYFIYAKLA